jgi:hypothetical protein
MLGMAEFVVNRLDGSKPKELDTQKIFVSCPDVDLELGSGWP